MTITSSMPSHQPAAHSASAVQYEQGPGEPASVALENNFPPEVWVAFFQQYLDLSPLFAWLDGEFRDNSENGWWETLCRRSNIQLYFCTYGLDEVVLVQKLQPWLGNHTESVVRRLTSITAALYGPQLRQQLECHNNCAAARKEDI
ncbi:hypothetical protein ASZ78_003075 [Callipepla squamata]|uniref:Uncharacterized protein n=1 Tax=Callipepla squamata TaxID=9009 RepID=A0A226MCV3_CALSU|nr:hypothetical protein ASZ78_003075 [Callipepla squamata]